MKLIDQIGKDQFNKGHEYALKANDEFDKLRDLKNASRNGDIDQISAEMNSANDAETVTPELVTSEFGRDAERVHAIHDAQIRHHNFVKDAADSIGRSATESLASTPAEDPEIISK